MLHARCRLLCCSNVVEGRQQVITYRAYGLTIESELLLPEFIAADGVPDVTIRWGDGSEQFPAEWLDQYTAYRAVPGETVMWMRGVGAFWLRAGRDIVVVPAPQADERLIQLYIAGNAMAAVLHQRGMCVLHASSVAVEGAAYAFIGASGQGKSSMAAALVAQQCDLVTDDLVVIDPTDTTLMVPPGYPQIKISEEAAVCLGYDLAALPLAHDGYRERVYRAPQRFASAPVPLAGVYILADGDDVQVDVLPLQRAFALVLEHSYGLRVFHQTIDTAAHLAAVSRIVREVPFFTLRRPRVLASLPELAAWFQAHVQQAGRPEGVPV